MDITHDTPIYKIQELADCAVSDQVSFDAASRLKRILIARGWHDSDSIPEKELARLTLLALEEPVRRDEPTPVYDGIPCAGSDHDCPHRSRVSSKGAYCYPCAADHPTSMSEVIARVVNQNRRREQRRADRPWTGRREGEVPSPFPVRLDHKVADLAQKLIVATDRGQDILPVLSELDHIVAVLTQETHNKNKETK